jgi:hypothetical protein
MIRILTLTLLLFNFFLEAQVLCRGKITDFETGEPLIGALISIRERSLGVTTDAEGRYLLKLEAGNYTLQLQYLGYASINVPMQIKKNTLQNFALVPVLNELDEVLIQDQNPARQLKSTEMSVAKLDIKQINKIPALLGEVDIVRALQLLPGISTMGEGASGLNVRGGNSDQNLILLDDAPVYNSSHLFGFFSIFNPDAVKDVKLYKGGIPAAYGGRASSLIDVRMKESSAKRPTVNGGIGTVFSRISIEMPLIKDKAGILIALRRSYLDALVKPFVPEQNPLKNTTFYFYDLTAKAHWMINPKNTITLSSYIGRDVFGASIFSFDWGNKTLSLRWNHVFNSKWVWRTTAFYSDYNYLLQFGRNSDDQSFKWNSLITNYSLKSEVSYLKNDSSILRMGVQSMFYDFLPYDAIGNFGSNTVSYLADSKYGFEHAAFISKEHAFSGHFKTECGLRVTLFQYIGKGTAYTFRDTLPNTTRPLDSETRYAVGEIIKQYIIPEPRLSLNYIRNDRQSLKFSYNRMSQFVQLINNTASSSPLDIYTLASRNLKPLISDQVALGYFHNFRDQTLETSLEVYYKYFQNQVDYIDNADLFINPTIENQLILGLGRAYGIEYYIKKNRGDWQGWVSYTLSRTERLMRGISNDNWFLSRYDRTHMLNVNSSYDFNKRLSASATFVFYSGVPATFPNAKIEIQNYIIPYNTDNLRNNYRITPYHRLDLGLTYHFKKNEYRRYKQHIVISAYNAYNRRNAFSIFFQAKESNPQQTEAIRFSVVGSIVPAITYNFSF